MAADTYSAILGWLNQGTGNNNNSWGDNCDNAIFPIFEKAIAGLSTRAVTGGTLDLSANAPPAGPTAALEMVQAFSGTLTSDQVVQVPNLPKLWFVSNGTTGAFSLKFKTPTGAASAAIPQGGGAFVRCDGNNNVNVWMSSTLRDIQWLGADGTLAAPGLSFSNEPTMGVRRKGAGELALTVDGVDVLTLSTSSVSISPAASFSVVPPGVEANYAGITEPDGWYFEFGQAKSRTTDAPLMNAITASFTASTNSNTTLSNVSRDLRGFGLEGAVMEGIGIPTGAKIASVDSATQITLTAAATTTADDVAMRAFPYGNGDGVNTFTLPDGRGYVYVGRDNMGGTAANRVTFAGSGIRANQLSAFGGSETITLVTANLPPYTPAGGIANGAISISPPAARVNNGSGGFGVAYGGNESTLQTGTFVNLSISQAASTFTGTAQGGTSTPFSAMQPSSTRNKIIKR